jgi:hypothetical protein
MGKQYLRVSLHHLQLRSDTNMFSESLPLRERFQHGKCAFGTWLMLPSAWTARIVAAAGWDVSDLTDVNFSKPP